MTSLTCSKDEETKFHQWLSYIEHCRERERGFITNVVLKMTKVVLEPWQYLPLISALEKYYEVFSKWNLVPPNHNARFKEAYTSEALVWKHVIGWLCPRHAVVHPFWCYMETSVKQGDSFKWKLRCYKPKYSGFV